MTRTLPLAIAVLLIGGVAVDAEAPAVVTAVVKTAPLFNFEDAPATPDADDPAIWVDRRRPGRALVIGTAKDAGLLVYDLEGTLLQAVRPPNSPFVAPEDPATPAPNDAVATPCPGSDSGETFGRYNNVDIAYDVPLRAGPHAPRADVAVVSDRGCDRVRFYAILPATPGGPLVDITDPGVPRVFPQRFDQPSAFQPSGTPAGLQDNPVDDQNTVYGLTVAAGRNDVFVSQRERGLVRQLRIAPAGNGRLTYAVQRTFQFDTSFDLPDEAGVPYPWTPCREAAQEEPQSEGVMVDPVNDALFVAFETIGMYRIPLSDQLPTTVPVGRERLIEPVKSFGRGYVATPDDDEFECEYDGTPEPGATVVPGSAANAGAFLEADLEGLALVAPLPGRTVLIASSQGDDSFHFYEVRGARPRHLGEFFVDGVGETDGVHYVSVPLGRRYPLGLLVVQNGDAPSAGAPDEVNGYEFDGSTQFQYLSFLDALQTLHP